MQHFRWRSPLNILAVSALLLVLIGCDDKKTTSVSGIHKEYTDRDCRLILDLSASQLTVADTLNVQLRLEYPEGWRPELPAFADKLGDFTVEKSAPGDPVLLADGKHVARTWNVVLLPFLPGDYALPAITATFTPEGKNPSAEQPHRLHSDEIRIPVAGVIDSRETSPALRDLPPPLTLPAPPQTWRIVAIAVAAVLLLGGLVVLCIRKRADRVPSAQEIALRDLTALNGRPPLTGEEMKAFYIALSGILRCYIEQRFSLAAPELTTEEFLAQLQEKPVLSEAHTKLLKNFLYHCDVVKFACYLPHKSEVDASVDSCRRFVLETPLPSAE